MEHMNEELLAKLANVETVDELNAILAENSIQLEEGVTPEAFLKTLKGDADELSEDSLDEVAGGVLLGPSINIQRLAAKLGVSIALYLRRFYRKGGGSR